MEREVAPCGLEVRVSSLVEEWERSDGGNQCVVLDKQTVEGTLPKEATVDLVKVGPFVSTPRGLGSFLAEMDLQ